MTEINKKWPWPGNIGPLGTYAEEVKTLTRLERNPEAAPMPQAEPTAFLTPASHSESLRMGPAAWSEVGDAAIPLPPSFVVFRRVLRKRKSRSWAVFEDSVLESDLGPVPDDRREQMKALLHQERAMLEVLERYSDLADAVYSRILAESKG